MVYSFSQVLPIHSQSDLQATLNNEHRLEGRQMRLLKVLLVIATLSVLTAAQVAKVQAPLTGSLVGKVFLVTSGGDLKQARFAEVYVLSGERAKSFKETAIAIQPSDAQLRREAHPSEDADGIVAKFACLKDRFAKLGEVAGSAPKATQTDEQGIFQLKLKPSTYTIVVVGKGGQNYAIWTGDVTLRAGQPSTMKLHEPVVACYDVLNQ